MDNHKRDAVVLFFSSKNEKNLEIVKKFQEFAKKYYTIEGNKEFAGIGHFDMSKNSHQIFKVKNEDLFLRLYKYGDFKKPLDYVLKEEGDSMEQIKLFLDHSSTHELNFGENEEF